MSSPSLPCQAAGQPATGGGAEGRWAVAPHARGVRQGRPVCVLGVPSGGRCFSAVGGEVLHLLPGSGAGDGSWLGFFYLYLIEDVFSVSGNPEVAWQACGQMGPMRSLCLWDRGASTGVFWLWAGAEAIA